MTAKTKLLMARKARVEFEGAVYHVLDRGDRREAIFKDDADRRRFLETLGEACARTGWRVHAYVLMSNHYHLMIETPQANLVAGMRWFQTTWTIRYNTRHRLSGHLFQGRYKAVVVDSQESRYFAVLSDYIHLNPVRARMIGLEERLFDYPWSSYPLYAARKGRPVWFEPRTVLGEMSLDDTAAGRRAYAERMRERAVDELARKLEPAELSELRRLVCGRGGLPGAHVAPARCGGGETASPTAFAAGCPRGARSRHGRSAAASRRRLALSWRGKGGTAKPAEKRSAQGGAGGAHPHTHDRAKRLDRRATPTRTCEPGDTLHANRPARIIDETGECEPWMSEFLKLTPFFRHTMRRIQLKRMLSNRYVQTQNERSTDEALTDY